MEKSYFITGVDTDIGKTFVTKGLCLKYLNLGLDVGYFKPLQSGVVKIDGKLSIPDVDEIRKINIDASFSYLFEGDISPHLATLINKQDIDLNKIKEDYNRILLKNDIVFIEGAGGLYCPAFRGKLFCDIIKFLDVEIIVVTSPKLGRLNHLLMTLECAKINNIKIKGIIINNFPINPTLSEKNFLFELSCFSDVEILGIIPEIRDSDENKITEAFKNINL